MPKDEVSKHPIYMNAFQMGVIATILMKESLMGDVWKQEVLQDVLDQIEKYYVDWKVLDK